MRGRNWRSNLGPWASLLGAAGALLPATLARAEVVASAEAVELAWEAPVGCPDEAAIRAAIQRWIEQSPDPLDTRQLYVDGRVEPEGRGFALELVLESQSGSSHERLHAERCETLVDVVALKVTLAATPPGVGDEASAPSDRPRPRRKRAPSSDAASAGTAGGGGDEADASTITPPSQEQDPTPIAVAIALLAGAELDPTSIELASNLALEVALRLGRWRVVGGGYYAPSRAHHYPDLPGTGAELQRLSARLQACPGVLPGPFTLAPCAGVELGVLRGTGVGVTQTSTSDQLWAAGLLGATLRVPLSNALFLGLDATWLFAFARPSFHVKDLSTLYQAPGNGIRVLAGLELLL